MKCCLFQSFSLAGRICSRGFTVFTNFGFATCLYTVWSHEVAVSCIHFYWSSVAFAPGRQDLTSDAIEHFLWPLLKRTAHFFFAAAKQPFNRGSKFLRRGFQGSSSFISYHKRLLNREQHSFPKLSQSHCTFQIVETWPWPLGYPIITRSAWNTGKALWPLLNVRLTIAKVIFGQILEYSLHCITLAKEKKKKENGNSRVTLRFCLV